MLKNFKNTQAYKDINKLLDNEIERVIEKDINAFEATEVHSYQGSIALIKAYKHIKRLIDVKSEPTEV